MSSFSTEVVTPQPPPPPPTLAEVITATILLILSTLILLSYALDALGWPTYPAPQLLTLFLAAVGLGLAWQRGWFASVVTPRAETLGWLVVVLGLAVYIGWLGREALLPVTQSSDTVHHAQLVDFLQQRRRLAAGAVPDYLGEMSVYPAGSHILAATLATALGLPGLRVMQVVLACLVALKAGLVYSLILRLVPPARRQPILAVTGALLLLLAYGYFISSFTNYYFYPMVVTETFVVAMLWAMVVWHQGPAIWPLLCFAAWGCTVLLTWPTWLPVPLLALAALVLLRRDQPVRARLTSLAWAIAPIIVVALLDALGLQGDRGVLTNEGSILIPSDRAYSRPLLALVAVGLVLSIRNRRAWPVWLISGALVAVTLGLFGLAQLGYVAYYLVYKMFYLLLYPMVIFAALGVDVMWAAFQRWRPASLRPYDAALVLALPLALLVLLARFVIPSPATPVMTESVYQAGLWAKANLPPGCVDYLVDDWITAYWLHIEVLGNPRASAYSNAVVETYAQQHTGPGRWQPTADLPYAIIDRFDQAPRALRQDYTLLHQVGSTAVAQRPGACHDNPTPIDQLVLPPRPVIHLLNPP